MFEFIKGWLRLKADHRAVAALECSLLAGVILETIAVSFSLLANDLPAQFVGTVTGF
jgi:hypothetical protein